nr:Nramp family divalent metal transporter [Paraflavitalea speifideiaquila]
MGIVRGRDLAQANRETYPKTVNFFLYLLAEVAIAATDLAEVLGMAIGIHLLTGIPIIWGVGITVLDTLLLLYLQRLGMRKMEVFIIGLVAVVGLSFFVEILLVKPDLAEVATGFVPTFPNDEALYIAIGIIGATVMPHNLYLHSALVQTRKIDRTNKGIKQALKWSFVDSAIALNIAFLVNAAILVLAATAFFKNGIMVDQIKDAHQLLSGVLGSKVAPVLFAIALIAAGQSSTVTGTLAGQIVMEGYLRLRINPWIRRLLTRLLAIVPAIIVIYIFGDKEVDYLLILSQVILSMQLGFAVIPLIHFVSDKKTMGAFAIKPIVQAAAWLIATVLVYLNIKMVANEAGKVFDHPGNLVWKIVIVLGGLLFLLLLLYTIFYPLFSKRRKPVSIQMHPDVAGLKPLVVPTYKKVAVALEFGEHDSAVLAHAIGQGKQDSEYVLIHIVESPTARILGQESDDFETRADEERLQFYIRQLTEQGFVASGHLGFRHRAKEIVRLVKDQGLICWLLAPTAIQG